MINLMLSLAMHLGATATPVTLSLLAHDDVRDDVDTDASEVHATSYWHAASRLEAHDVHDDVYQDRDQSELPDYMGTLDGDDEEDLTDDACEEY